MTGIAFAYAIQRNNSPIETNSAELYPWWSIAKAVLAAAVLRLAERGAVDLEASYEDWPFSIRQLLNHRAGLKDYASAEYHAAVASGCDAWPPDMLLSRCNARELLYRPAEGWAYSNIGYLFIRRVIEKVTRCDLNAALAELIFAPLEMRSAFVASTREDLCRSAWGNAANYDPGWVYHGLLLGTPGDAVQFLQGLLGGKLLSARMLDTMLASYHVADEIPGRPWQQAGYGLGLMIGRMRGVGRAIGHSGGGPGSVSALYAFPDREDRAIVSVFAEGHGDALAEEAAVERITRQ